MKTEKQLAWLEILRRLEETAEFIKSIEDDPILNHYKANAIESLYDLHAAIE